MQGSNYTIYELAQNMQTFHVNIDTINDPFELQSMCAEVCIFHDAHIEDENYGDTLRLANDMAIQCIEATVLNMCKRRFESCYSCIKALASE